VFLVCSAVFNRKFADILFKVVFCVQCEGQNWLVEGRLVPTINPREDPLPATTSCEFFGKTFYNPGLIESIKMRPGDRDYDILTWLGGISHNIGAAQSALKER
jgi:hypothetical protein